MFFRAMCWKELREQRLQAVVLTALSALFLAAVMPLFRSGFDDRGDIPLAAIVLSGACGMVTGAILLANESETHTQTFLDMLPKQRFGIWKYKALIGVAVTAVQALVLTVVARFAAPSSSGIFGDPNAVYIIAYLGGFFGLGCGMFGSAVASTVLAAVGWGIVYGIASGMALAGVIGVVEAGHRTFALDRGDGKQAGVLLWLLLTPLPLVLSGLIHTRLDRRRKLMARSAPERRLWRIPGIQGLRSSLWLSLRQGRWFFVGISVAALLAGPLVLIEPLAIWPILTLIFGLILGVAVVGDEQFYGAYRFLAEQRLPLGRWWLVKLMTRLLVAVVVVVLMGATAALAVVIVEDTSLNPLDADRGGFIFRMLVDQIGGPVFLFLFLTYGFAFGQIAGLLARKSVVALAIGFPAAIIAVSIWLPSIISGGVPSWELFAIPFVLVVTCRLLLWSWATNRLLSRRALFVQGSVVLLAISFVGLSFARRVWEIPASSPPAGIAEFAASYPTRDQNPVRSALFRAADQFDRLYSTHRSLFEGPDADWSYHPHVRADSPKYAGYFVLLYGWPKDDEIEKRLISELVQDGWIAACREAAEAPPTPLEDPRDEVLGSSSWLKRLKPIGQWLAFNALYEQSLGHHTEALNLLIAELAIARNIQTKATANISSVGDYFEAAALLGLERWSEDSGVPDELLEKALQEIQNHEKKRPSLKEMVMAEYLLMREYVNSANPSFDHSSKSQQHWANSLVGLALQIPWERARRELLINACFEQLSQSADLDSTPILRLIYQRRDSPVEEAIINDLALRSFFWRTNTMYQPGLRKLNLCSLRALQMRLALNLYARRTGTPASALTDLIPQYFSEIPINPYNGWAFRYRLVRQDEWIKWPDDARLDRPDEWGIDSAQHMILPVNKPTPTDGLYRRIDAGTGVLSSDQAMTLRGRGIQQTSGWYSGGELNILIPIPRSKK